MFDPLTVAHEIKYPWKRKPSEFWPTGYRGTFITIWHKDPCTDGSDNSCDWHGSKRPLNIYEKKITEAVWQMENILDNKPFYPEHPAHLRFQVLKDAIWDWRKRRGFRIHPRWHVWHWRIQIHPLQKLKQWIFDRCCVCKKGFKYRESRIGNWDGDLVWHHDCDNKLRVTK